VPRIETTRQRPRADRPQRPLGMVSIHLPSLRSWRHSTSETFRWSSSGHARRRSAVAAYRDHPATAPRGPTPSDRLEWSRYVSASSFVAASTTRPARHSAGRVAATRDEGASCRVSRPPGNGSARPNPQRQPGVVSIRHRQLLRRGVDYSTSETLRWSSSRDERAKSLRIETTRQRPSAGQPPATAQSGLDTPNRAPSSPLGLLDQRGPRGLERLTPADRGPRRGLGCTYPPVTDR
jgi:hypothetical protein